MCAKLPCAPNNIHQWSRSDRAEYTRKSQLTEDKSKCHKNKKVRADRNKLRAEKEWRPYAQ